ncbi:MAG: hypothetical protein FOGNACKC_05286 [Anaerolineae bacterium]|nr:hypothetical protein [Anaerolineae bacterium]
MFKRALAFPTKLRHHPGLGLALLLYLLLALIYFFAVPIFEAPDEWTHTGHVKYIARGNGLPVMLPGRGIWGGQQPPLYYALGALLVQPFELDSFDGYAERHKNPHASLGYALDPGNKNNYLHGPTENFPYRGLSLTVHILRLYSLGWGVIALVFIYFTAYELYDLCPSGYFGFTIYTPYSLLPTPYSQPGWFATAVALFAAVQPMFAFITASVANEPANIAACAAAVYLSQRYALRGPSYRLRRPLALGLALGLAALAKMTGLAVGLVAVVAFLQAAIRYRQQPEAVRRLWRDGLLIGLMFLLVAGWWYWRNMQLYGDFFQRGLYKLYFNVDPQPLSLSQFIYTLRTGEVSFWATFGWLNIVAPDWVYTVYRVISRVGLAGAALAIVAQFWRPGVRHREPGIRSHKRNDSPFILHPSPFTLHPLLLHLVFPLALAFSLTRLVATEGGMQGRQLLPALGSLAIVVLWGWWALLPAKIRGPLLGGLLAGLLALAAWLPLGVMAKEYWPRPLLAETDLPTDLPRLNWTINGEMKLLGVRINADVVHPGQRVPVTVYWQALKPMATNYSVFVHLIGRDYQTVGQFNTYPGLGLRPTTGLKSGEIVADTYPVQVEGGSGAPTRLLVNVGLFNFEEEGRPGLPIIDASGAAVAPTVGALKLTPAQWPTASPPIADFAGQILLARPHLEGCTGRSAACTITFEWQPQARPAADYTVFVQVWQNGQQVAGFDAPPLAGDYPTGMWQPGEVIIDPHRLDLSALPPGDYQIFSGLYNYATGDRLPASANGQPLPNNAIDLGRISIN